MTPAPPTPPEPPETPIVFFDGVCGLCNALVSLLLRVDRRGRFRFAPLQGQTARRLLPQLPQDPQAWALAYLGPEGFHQSSEAVLAIIRHLGGPWRLLGALRVIPRPAREALYRGLARRRYRWFGRRASCRVPAPEEAARFLP